MSQEHFQKGLTIRKELAGAAYVEQALSDPEEFGHPMQELVTEYCWGAVWSRPNLDRRSRSILNLGMLAALNRQEEFASHVKIALKNGVTKAEIRECLLQIGVYCGMPAGLTAFRVAKKALDDVGA